MGHRAGVPSGAGATMYQSELETLVCGCDCGCALEIIGFPDVGAEPLAEVILLKARARVAGLAA